MSNLDELKAFNVMEAEVALWTFKKQVPKDSPPKFNGHWVDTTDDMDIALRHIANQEITSITEEFEYDLLSENNESSVLTIQSDETHAGYIIGKSIAELPQRKVKNIKTLLNASFYIIKLINGESVIYCFCKTDATWRSRQANNMVTGFFSDTRLELSEDPGFKIHRRIDFFIFGETVYVKNKAAFESVLNYKQAHENDFLELKDEKEFGSIFVDVQPLTDFVGSNKIQLRRMSAIRQKGFYKDSKFMGNLRKKYKEFGLVIEFDGDGLIIPSAETCRDIIAALLDHRLGSGFSGNIYDVPDAKKV